MVFNEENTKKVLAEGNNRNNSSLKHSIQVANNRYKSRKRGNMSSSEEEDHEVGDRHRKEERARHTPKPKQMIVYKKPDEPHQELAYLLHLFSSQISAFDSSVPIERFTP